MQISIDNVNPDDVSKKSLKVLDKKLQMLAEHATFGVNVNSVIGGWNQDPGGCIDRQSPRRGTRSDHDSGHHP